MIDSIDDTTQYRYIFFVGAEKTCAEEAGMGHNNFFRHFLQLCAVLLEGFPHLRSRFGNKEPVQLLQLPVTFFASKIMGDFVSDFVN